MSEVTEGGSEVVVNFYRLICREKVGGSQRIPLLTKFQGGANLFINDTLVRIIGAGCFLSIRSSDFFWLDISH